MHRLLLLFAPMVAVWGVLGPTPLGAQLDARESSEILQAHNRWRANHGAAPLQWSDDLARYAQAWAEILAADYPGRLFHSEEGGRVRPEAIRLGYGGWGENLHWSSAIHWSDGRRGVQPTSGNGVVDGWGAEVQWYDFATGRCSPHADPGCGHFTQVVWQATTSVGCGRAIGSDHSQVWACSYDPPGNYVGRYVTNVLPAGSR